LLRKALALPVRDCDEQPKQKKRTKLIKQTAVVSFAGKYLPFESSSNS